MDKVGKAGRPIKLFTNHFNMEIKKSCVHIYEINLKFPWKNIRKRDKPLHYRCVEQIKRDNAGKVCTVTYVQLGQIQTPK